MSIFYCSLPTGSKRQQFEEFKEFKKRSQESGDGNVSIAASLLDGVDPRPPGFWILAPGSSS